MIQDTIHSLFVDAIKAAQQADSLPQFELPAFEVLRPKQADHGDYSCNAAMVVSAAIRKSTGEKVAPRQIAGAILEHLPPSPMVERTEIAGPGFINLWLGDHWIQQQVPLIVGAGEAFGNIARGDGKNWQVEYVSANPTGPIHYGGARNAVLGDSLANVLEAAGHTVQREFYVNDAGNQFNYFVASVYARYAQLLGKDVPLPENGYPGDYIIEYARTIAAEHGDRFLQLPEQEAVQAIKPLARTLVLSELEIELQRIGVVFDKWYSEQSLHDEGLIDQTLAYLEQRGELARRDGAVWFVASKYPNNDKDEVVIRSNGIPTYFASDIAYHYDKFLRRGFDRVVNVWAVDHQGHVPRMAAMMQAFGLDPSRLIILMYDLVKLIREGQEVKLSKRAGNVLTIGDVVDEVGADALRFNLLTRSPESTIEFDLDLAIAQSNENPVYFVQYSHARICSILNRAEAEGFTLQVAATGIALDLLSHTSELALIRKLLELEEQIELAVLKLSPHNLTHYALDLARTFNAFYRDCKVIDATQAPLTQARLLLSQAARTGLARTLSLIGVNAPESM
jgi:arginyl-tRNA synthetase